VQYFIGSIVGAADFVLARIKGLTLTLALLRRTSCPVAYPRAHRTASCMPGSTDRSGRPTTCASLAGRARARRATSPQPSPPDTSSRPARRAIAATGWDSFGRGRPSPRHLGRASGSQHLDRGRLTLRVCDPQTFAVSERRAPRSSPAASPSKDRGQIDDPAVRDREHALLLANARGDARPRRDLLVGELAPVG